MCKRLSHVPFAGTTFPPPPSATPLTTSCSCVVCVIEALTWQPHGWSGPLRAKWAWRWMALSPGLRVAAIHTLTITSRRRNTHARCTQGVWRRCVVCCESVLCVCECVICICSEECVSVVWITGGQSVAEQGPPPCPCSRAAGHRHGACLSVSMCALCQRVCLVSTFLPESVLGIITTVLNGCVQEHVGVSEWKEGLEVDFACGAPPAVADDPECAADGHGAKVVSALLGEEGEGGHVPVRLDPSVERVSAEGRARLTAFVKRWRQHFLDRFAPSFRHSVRMIIVYVARSVPTRGWVGVRAACMVLVRVMCVCVCVCARRLRPSACGRPSCRRVGM